MTVACGKNQTNQAQGFIPGPARNPEFYYVRARARKAPDQLNSLWQRLSAILHRNSKNQVPGT
jgi:hypothetical protein